MTSGDPGDPEVGSSDDAAIGVGMGGSCPECRAPVDLGQEFCLECGSPIRFSAKQRRRGRSAAGAPADATVPPRLARPGGRPPGQRGFPWIPFLVVLALVVTGTGFALAGGDGEEKSDKGATSATTEEALPSISTEAPTTDTSAGGTTTLQDCDPTQPLGGDQGTSDEASDGTGETIPELTPNGETTTDGTDSFADTSTEPPTSDAVTGDTVDQNGVPCTGETTDTTATDTTNTNTSTSATSPTTTTSRPSTTAGAWPEGKDGWTVIVFGYPSESRANQSAAELQAKSIESGVLFSTDYGSLCPGIWVVFSGVHDTKAQADAHLQELVGKGYGGMYAREVAKNGTATGCG